MSHAPARVLTIAGSDCSGGAGLQADLKTIAMLGGYGMSAVTAITVQNTLGVRAIEVLSPELVAGQIAACVDDIGVDAVKIGMLGSAAVAHAVADALALVDVPVVLDPVMVATSGGVLADGETVAAMARLMARATLVTPNGPEVAALGGEAALVARCRAVLVKGGHGDGDALVDRLIADSSVRLGAIYPVHCVRFCYSILLRSVGLKPLLSALSHNDGAISSQAGPNKTQRGRVLRMGLRGFRTSAVVCLNDLL